MDDLTSAIQRVIDADPVELEWVLDMVRYIGVDYDSRDNHEMETREGHINTELADELREHVCGYPDQITTEDCTPMQFVGLAVSHVYTHANWRALASYYIQKVSEGC